MKNAPPTTEPEPIHTPEPPPPPAATSIFSPWTRGEAHDRLISLGYTSDLANKYLDRPHRALESMEPTSSAAAVIRGFLRGFQPGKVLPQEDGETLVYSRADAHDRLLSMGYLGGTANHMLDNAERTLDKLPPRTGAAVVLRAYLRGLPAKKVPTPGEVRKDAVTKLRAEGMSEDGANMALSFWGAVLDPRYQIHQDMTPAQREIVRLYVDAVYGCYVPAKEPPRSSSEVGAAQDSAAALWTAFHKASPLADDREAFMAGVEAGRSNRPRDFWPALANALEALAGDDSLVDAAITAAEKAGCPEVYLRHLNEINDALYRRRLRTGRAEVTSKPTSPRTFPRVTLGSVAPGSLIENAGGFIALALAQEGRKHRRLLWVDTGMIGDMHEGATVSLRATPAELDALTSADAPLPPSPSDRQKQIERLTWLADHGGTTEQINARAELMRLGLRRRPLGAKLLAVVETSFRAFMTGREAPPIQPGDTLDGAWGRFKARLLATESEAFPLRVSDGSTTIEVTHSLGMRPDGQGGMEPYDDGRPPRVTVSCGGSGLIYGQGDTHPCPGCSECSKHLRTLPSGRVVDLTKMTIADAAEAHNAGVLNFGPGRAVVTGDGKLTFDLSSLSSKGIISREPPFVELVADVEPTHPGFLNTGCMADDEPTK